MEVSEKVRRSCSWWEEGSGAEMAVRYSVKGGRGMSVICCCEEEDDDGGDGASSGLAVAGRDEGGGGASSGSTVVGRDGGVVVS